MNKRLVQLGCIVLFVLSFLKTVLKTATLYDITLICLLVLVFLALEYLVSEKQKLEIKDMTEQMKKDNENRITKLEKTLEDVRGYVSKISISARRQ